MVDEKLLCDSIPHIVHDWSNLVAAGTMTGEPISPPMNHFVQHAFLVECRKFADFFSNNRGPDGNDVVSKDFQPKRFKPRLPEWKKWRDHMNQQLMHLSLNRVKNKIAWDGSANASLLREFRNVWNEFLKSMS